MPQQRKKSDEAIFTQELGNVVIFVAGTPSSATALKLYRYDPANGIQRLSNINGSELQPDVAVGSSWFGVIQNKFLFVGNQSAGGSQRKLFLIDATSAGGKVVQISNTNPGADDETRRLVIYNGTLFFISRTQTTPSVVRKLFAYDDSTGMIFRVSNTTLSMASDDFPLDITPRLGQYHLYFRAVGPGGTGDDAVYTVCDLSLGVICD